MKTFQMFLAFAGVAGALVTALPADAHGIWFAQRARQLALIYGIGADDLDAVKRLPLVNTVEGLDASWAPVKISLRAAGAIPVVDTDEPVTAVAAAMDYGMWSKTPDGEWHNKGKDEVSGATVAERTMKYAVHIADLSKAQLPVIPSQTLQIVPVDLAIPEQMGKPIQVRVLFKGKPIAAAVVINDLVNDPDQIGQKSGADGLVTLPIRNQGLNVLAATYVGPTDAPAKYDRIEYRATLSFVLPHAPE